ncbi:hypothetical protein [Wenjunlia tyrosinilytica]|uniref:Uncharacterized protein n=1 Tax=Wenjunlia tyrosinilytica TaxID=1544741 RepID=A0A917ZFN3_9ACTN|nr:hypothetical protein [Wenjunlia tyrosinilytica]GGO82460.1 hypothetical protein GCM10012280_09110 [Wenjunlia tyrosinilytica]
MSAFHIFLYVMAAIGGLCLFAGGLLPLFDFFGAERAERAGESRHRP